MTTIKSILLTIISSTLIVSTAAFAHGDMVPQAVDTTGLEKLGSQWLSQNPYSGLDKAIEIGDGAYNQNCARCHGLEAKSGGIAPDLRALELGADGDEWFIYRIRNGATRNGIPYMPAFEDTLSQEAMWAIRAYLETKYDPNL